MRILIISEYFWPESFRVNDLALGLRDRGHEVEVLTGLPNYPAGRYFDGYSLRGPYQEKFEGITVHRVPVVARGDGVAWRLLLKYASFALSATAAIAYRRRDWDAVLVFQVTPVTTICPALLPASAGIPVLTWIQDLWPETLESTGVVRSRAGLWLAGLLSRMLYLRCDRLLVQSEAYIPPLRRMGVPDDRVDYVPNWAESLYEETPPSPLLSEPWQQGFSVMFAGNLGRVQALETVLEAAERLRGVEDCHWVFLGDGALRQWLEDEVRRRQLGSVVHLVGRKPTKEMPRYFSSASAMLVSLKREDILAMTIPSKVQSYLAAGRPIIGSLDGEGARIIEESEAGWASPAGDSAKLAENVLRMRSAGARERERMGRMGREYYRVHFSRDACLERIERAFEGAVRATQLVGRGA